MVFASIAFIFASKSGDQFPLASSEHFVNFPPAGFSVTKKTTLYQLWILSLLKRCFAPSNLDLADIFKTGRRAQS